MATTRLHDAGLVDGQSSLQRETDTAEWKLSFWTRPEHDSGEGRRIEIWCKSEGEARQIFGDYRRILESHTLVITRVELLGPSGEAMGGI